MNQYDIAVVGAGIVGAACALSLQNAGFKVALIDQKQTTLAVDAPAQTRVSAINHASMQLLQNLGVWDELPAARLAPILAMKISAGFDEAIDFNAAEFGFAELGFIVENDFLIQALLEKFKATEGRLFCPDHVKKIERQQEWQLQLTQDVIQAKLLVIAQGAQASLREQLKVESETRFYNQKALVINVASREPHRFCAYQRFLKTGPVAFLPLFERNWSSIVWTLPMSLAEDYLRLNETELMAKLFEAFPDLGALTFLNKPQAFELSAMSAKQYFGEGFVLVGDSAHTVHPLAGQGVNLGLNDVICLKKALNATTDIDSNAILSQYASACQAKNRAFSLGFSVINRLFQLEQPWFKRIIGVGFSGINRLHGVKRQMVQLARGDIWTP